MKRIFLLAMLLLTGCVPSAASPVPTSIALRSLPSPDWSSYQHAVGAFQVDETCAHLCWLGIHPGVTTVDEALRSLDASDQIDQSTLSQTDTGLRVEWFTDSAKALRSRVYLYVQQGIVESISFEDLAPWTLADISDLLGEPDQITISMDIEGDLMYMPYAVYFASQKVLASADAGEPGPHPNDSLVALKLNLEYSHESFQRWIGYGHLDVYLSEQPAHVHPSGAGSSGP